MYLTSLKAYDKNNIHFKLNLLMQMFWGGEVGEGWGQKF